MPDDPQHTDPHLTSSDPQWIAYRQGQIEAALSRLDVLTADVDRVVNSMGLRQPGHSSGWSGRSRR
jgi:hypothetical protein